MAGAAALVRAPRGRLNDAAAGTRRSATLADMAHRADVFDLGRLRLTPGEARRFDLEVDIPSLRFGGEPYAVVSSEGATRIPVHLDVSRMTGGGYALRLRASAQVTGPCQRCLEPAEPGFEVDAREVDQPGGGEELASPYVADEVLDVAAWARDALVLTLPAQIVCDEACSGLCPVCGENLNGAPDHDHGRAPDPRWSALRELRLD